MTTTLHYRSHVLIDDLALDECTVHRATDKKGATWWNLWFHVARETDGEPEVFVVPVAPGGKYVENGPGGRTWGFTNMGHGVWEVSPSINVLNDEDARRAVAGVAPTGASLWHKTPTVVDVPDGEPWADGATT